MIRIEINKNEFEKNKNNNQIIKQEIYKLKYSGEIIKNGIIENISIIGTVTLTGETPDFYELSQFNWETNNNLGGEWNNQYDIDSFINKNYSLSDYVDDEIIDKIISEKNIELSHKYYITNLPPASEVSIDNPVNMNIEREFDGKNEEITDEIINILNWKNYYTPNINGLGKL